MGKSYHWTEIIQNGENTNKKLLFNCSFKSYFMFLSPAQNYTCHLIDFIQHTLSNKVHLMFKSHKSSTERQCLGSYCDVSLNSSWQTTKNGYLLLRYSHLTFICKCMEWDASSQPAAGGTSLHSVVLDTSTVSGNYPPVGVSTQLSR